MFNLHPFYLVAAKRVRGTRMILARGTNTRMTEDSAWMLDRLAVILPRRSVTLNTDMSTRPVQAPRLQEVSRVSTPG